MNLPKLIIESSVNEDKTVNYPHLTASAFEVGA